VTENEAEGLVPHFPICLVKLSALLPYYHTFSFYIALESLKSLLHCLLLHCSACNKPYWSWNVLHLLCFT